MLTDNTGTVVSVLIGVVVLIAVVIIDLMIIFVGIWLITKRVCVKMLFLELVTN